MKHDHDTKQVAGRSPGNITDAPGEVFRSLFDAIGEPTLVVDSQNGEIVFANKAACEYYGYSFEKLTSMNVTGLSSMPPGQVVQVVRNVANGNIHRLETQHRLANGQIREVELFFGRQNFGGRILNIVTVMDVTERKQASELLMRSEERAHFVMNNMREGVLLLDQDWRYVYINDAAEYQGQRPRSELLNRTLMECWPGFEETEIFKVEKQVMQTGVPAQMEGPFGMPDGLEHWFEWRIQPLGGGLLILTMDITQRKQLEQEKEAAELLYRDMFYNVDVIKVLIDPLDGQIVQTNQAAETFYGLTMAKMQTMNIAQFNISAPVQIYSNLQNALTQARSSFEVKHRLANGEIRDMEVHAKPVILQGRKLVYSIIFDITQRKQAEAALRESEQNSRRLQERLNNVIRGASLGTWEWNVQTGEVIFNERWAEMVGYTLNELAPDIHTWERMVHPDDLKISEQLLARVFSRELDAYQMDCRMRHRSGEWVWVHDEGRVMEWDADGKPLWMVGTHFDISARKNAELALEKARAELEQRVLERTAELKVANALLEKAVRSRDEFMAAMSHELRTPLTGIIGLSQVLQMSTYGDLTPRQANAVVNIQQSGQRLLDVVDDVLLYAELQGGKVQARPRPVGLASLCQAGLGRVAQQAAKKRQVVHFETAPEEIQMLVDEALLDRALVNLLLNATKFTPAGGEFGIRVKGLCDEQKVQICVWDTGIGIRQEDVARLFMPLVQLDASLARQYEGTGLGLVLVRLIAALLGGDVAVESTFGAGSRFTITLPWQAPVPG